MDTRRNFTARNSQLTARDYFLQEQPHLGNQYLEDTPLREVLQRVLPTAVLQDIEPDLTKFGQRVLGDVRKWGNESENNPPRLVHHNGWGRRIDDIVVTNGWKELAGVSAEEGLVAIGYERKHKEWSRLHQFVKLYLFAPSSAVFGCPLAMTDGAARLLELWGTPEDISGVYRHLVSRDPQSFWTSGQWMTERTGGSDVSGTETIAKKREDGLYNLTGYKYFTSAVTSELALLLARIEDKDGKSVSGSKGLSCFLAKTRKENGDLNNIAVHRLKNKLGTKAVPTAELELNDTVGKLVGPEHKGVPVISTILNITRIHNAINSVSAMRRGIAIARDYSHRRVALGRPLSEHPLHLQTLTDMEVQYRGGLQLMVDVLVLLGKVECKVATKTEDIMLRFLTPLLKLYTAKQSIAVASEVIESMGGTGYMEDSDIPRILRDTQVGSIWEGTTNVLSLDIWRPIQSLGALQVFEQVMLDKLSKVSDSRLVNPVAIVKLALNTIMNNAKEYSKQPQVLETFARHFAFNLSQTYIATLLLEHAQWSGSQVDIEVARRWSEEQVKVKPASNNPDYVDLNRTIALDIDPRTKQPRGAGDKDPSGQSRSRY